VCSYREPRAAGSRYCQTSRQFPASDNFTFGFRAEEFAKPHLDESLTAAQIPANAKALSAILGSQSRIVILVESIERLLEKPTRDAFADLLALVAGNSAIRLIMTCRDYSIDLVRASFLNRIALPLRKCLRLTIQNCRRSNSHSGSRAAIEEPALRAILRESVFLDKALDMSWPSDRPLPRMNAGLGVILAADCSAEHRLSPGTAERVSRFFKRLRCGGLAHCLPNGL